MKKEHILILALTSLFSGCVFTVHDLPVDYTYSGQVPALAQPNKPNLTVTEIKDTRTVENNRMIMNQTSGYGQTTTGGWQAEKELSLIVVDALVQGFEAAGLIRPNAENIAISGELIGVDSEIVTGWTKATINMSVTVKLSANKGDQIIWRDTLVGNGTSGKQTSIKNALKESFSDALNDLVSNLLSDDYFRQQVIE